MGQEIVLIGHKADLNAAELAHKMTTPLEALTKFSRQDPTPEYFVRFFAEVNDEKNDRGAVILLGSNAELCLRYAIKRHLVTADDADWMLFYGPLRGFEAKIRIGFTMGLYGPETKHNLDCIKAIRNAFAHAVIPISFETLEVQAAVEIMTMPEILPPKAVDETGKMRGILGELPTTRKRFQKICEAVTHNLFVLPDKRGSSRIAWMPLP